MTRDIHAGYRFSNEADPKKDKPDRPPDTKKPRTDTDQKPYPPDGIPNPMPGVDPQQTPGIDHPPAERN